MPNRVPAPRPCLSCPYRRDVPSGLWDPSEYEKLPGYDGPIGEQSPGAFYCHQQDGKLCAGWVACHDMNESLALRLSASIQDWPRDEVEAVLDYETDVPTFASGREAALHGLKGVENPSPKACKLIDKITRRTHDRARNR